MDDPGIYGIAIDGAGALCRVPASNAGHLLYTGLPRPDRAAKVMEQLLTAVFDSGWGLRTLPRDSVRYNPMSYHNGSVWPHDTALCAAGFARYGNKQGAVHWLDELFRVGDPLRNAHAGAALRFPATARRTADRVSGGVPAAGVVSGLCVHAAAGLSRASRLTPTSAKCASNARPCRAKSIACMIRGLAVAGNTIDLDFHRADGRVVAEPASPIPAHLRVSVRL